MSKPTAALSDGELKHLLSIEYLEEGVYRVELVSKNGESLKTIGRITDVDLGDGNVKQVTNFDSEEFGKQVMTGKILSIPICNAIAAFHAAT